ncbi:MAG: hypothetical protein EOO56_07620 [Hymenobacter sp.]|nr:MAG: hypothetical protein EOO56_07620 [Hymenobacter sp.]
MTICLTLTYIRNYRLRLDGDIAAIVMPRGDYAHVLHDPFGWDVLLHNSVYAGPNRFFAHAAMNLYFRSVPLLLQRIFEPVASLYTAMALFNVGVQALLLYVMGWYATGIRRLTSWRLWLGMALMLPFFQTTGYNQQMAIMDNSITYNFFYPLPLMMLLVLLWPLYRAMRQQVPARLPALHLVAMLLLSVVLAFNGPIITGTVLVLLLGVGLHTASQRWRLPAGQWLVGLPWQAVLLWSWLGVLCLYSLYIGRNNSENLTAMLPLWERIKLVPLGIYKEFSPRLGVPLLVLSCLTNVQLIRNFLPASVENERLMRTLRWVGLFALAYVVLLPLGGYRSYRPFILHHDCIVPITVSLVMFYGLSTTHLLLCLRGRARNWYMGAAMLIAAIYLYADRRMLPPSNGLLEREALEIINHAGPGPVVQLPREGPVLSWDPITEPLSSLTNAELLQYWNVTKDLKMYYYQRPEQENKPQ